MFCPKCRTEYRKGFYICADCGVTLVPELPPEEQDQPVPEYVSKAEEKLGLKLLAEAPSNTILLKTTNDSMEAITIAGLLDVNGIASYTISKGPSSDIGRLDWSLLTYNIFVDDNLFNQAQKIINSQDTNTDVDREWMLYKQKEEKKEAFWGRTTGLIIAIFFYTLSLLPMKESDATMRHILEGASICFVLLVLISCYRGKKSK